MDIAQITQKVFAKLGQEKQLIEYHEILFKLLGLVIDFINVNGVSLKLSGMKHFNPYCAALRGTDCGFQACRKCDQDNASFASRDGIPRIYQCYAGLTEIVVPLYDRRGIYIGSMTSGQFHSAAQPPLTETALAKLAHQYGLKPEEMIRRYRRTRKLSKLQIEGVIEYLNAIGRLIVSAHNNLMFMEKINTPDRIELIRKFVEENYSKTITVGKTAQKFCLSPSRFSHFFKHETGISFMNYVNMYRVMKAEEMLKETEAGISEIAFLSGFGSISQFNRVFKAATGRSPRKFR